MFWENRGEYCACINKNQNVNLLLKAVKFRF